MGLLFQKETPNEITTVIHYVSPVLLTAKSGSWKESLCGRNVLSQNFGSNHRLFSYSSLFSFAQSAIFTLYEGTGDLNSKGFSGGMGNRLGWMTEFNMQVVDIFLARGHSWLCSLIIGFSKKFDPGYPTIMSLILQLRMISPSKDLTTMLFQWSIKTVFPYESSHIRENRLNLYWDKTSWARECEPTQSHQLVGHWFKACLSL